MRILACTWRWGRLERIVDNPYLGITSRLLVIRQIFLESNRVYVSPRELLTAAGLGNSVLDLRMAHGILRAFSDNDKLQDGFGSLGTDTVHNLPKARIGVEPSREVNVL